MRKVRGSEDGSGVRLLKGKSEFESLADAWTRLASQNDLPVFQRYEWTRAWVEHLGDGGEPWLLVTGDPVQGILPLFAKRRASLRVLTLIGHGVSDYLGPVCGSSDAAARLGAGLGTLSRQVDLTILRGIDIAAPQSEPFLREIGRPLLERLYERCPAIDTQQGWDAFWRGRKKKFRANAKHVRRRVEDQGSVAVAVEAPSPELFDEMVAVERASWKWKGGFSFLRDTNQRAFMREVVLCPEVAQDIWTCRIDGELAGFAQVFTQERSWHYYWPSFREEAWGVGMYLMDRIVQRCCELEMQEFDFLSGDEAYKLRWMTHERRTHEIVVAGRYPFGVWAARAIRLRWWLARSERLSDARRRFLVLVKASRR